MMTDDLLAVDVGNTQVAVGYVTAGEVVHSFRLDSDARRTADEYGVLLRGLLARAAAVPESLPSVLCSVVPALTDCVAEALTRYFGAAPALVRAEDAAALGLEVRYDNVAEVGPDRLVNALAVARLYGAPAIAIDFGTATTFDVVDRGGAYVGGVIAPGVKLSAATLFAKAARLGAVSFTMPLRVVGRNTDEAVRSGILVGAAAAADGIVAAIQKERGERGQLVATGGLAAVVAPLMAAAPTVDADLTLKGLALVAERLGVAG